MALFDKLREELDRAGRSAQRALDEGRLRLDLYRARQAADRYAQRLGYAVFRARQAGTEIAPEEYASHANNLRAAEAEVARLDTLVAEAAKGRKTAPGNTASDGTAHTAEPEAGSQASATSGVPESPG
jgi:hypothetical protein